MLKNPMMIGEALAQGVSDGLDQKGTAYCVGYIGGVVVTSVAADKGLSKLGKLAKGTKALGRTEDVAKAAVKAEDVVTDSLDDLVNTSRKSTKMTWDERGTGIREGGSGSTLDYTTSNGLKLEATQGRTTTVLGTYQSDTGAILDELGNIKSLDFGPRDGSFNLLNTPDELYVSPNQFWTEYNKPWLDNVIARDDIVKIATEPTWNNLTRINRATGKTELTGFGREYTYLKKHGYTFDTITKIMSK